MASADFEEKREIAMSDSASAMRRLIGYARPHLKEFLVVVALVIVYIQSNSNMAPITITIERPS